VKDSQKSALERIVARVLVATVAVGSLATLLDAGAKYPGAPWRAESYVREPSTAPALELAPPGLTPREFRLSGNLPIGDGLKTCAAAEPNANSASQVGDEPFDINSAGRTTVKAVGDFPYPDLLSWPGDYMYHRALRF
jgi:hypothetical protein